MLKANGDVLYIEAKLADITEVESDAEVLLEMLVCASLCTFKICK